jgi:hypothetical protein
MSTLFVQFSDSTEKVVISIFGGAQDPSAYLNQGEIESDDPRYSSYFGGIPEDLQKLLPMPDRDAAAEVSSP